MIQRETGLTVEQVADRYAANLTHCFDFSPSPGWADLVDRTLAKLVLLKQGIQIAQAKSKFGQLDLHFVDAESESAYVIVRNANQQSRRICEDCGEPGYTREPKGRWLVTCCDECAAARAATGGAP